MTTPRLFDRELPIDPRERDLLRALIEVLRPMDEHLRHGSPLQAARGRLVGQVLRFITGTISSVQSLDNSLESCFRLWAAAPGAKGGAAEQGAEVAPAPQLASPRGRKRKPSPSA